MNPIHAISEVFRHQLGTVLTSTLARLSLAAVLGGVIGLERQLRHKPAGLRTNMFICFGAAMFTVLSKQLAGTDSDSARIAAQIIPGIGFIGANASPRRMEDYLASLAAIKAATASIIAGSSGRSASL